MEEQEEAVTLTGELVDLSSRFWSEGWGFGKIKVAGLPDSVRITGALEGLRLGAQLIVTGRYFDGKYGRELRVETLIEEEPRNEDGIKRWIVERVPQIGPVRATAIVNRFGTRAWDVFENSPHELEEIEGLTPERIQAIVRTWQHYAEERKRLAAYYDLGLTQRESRRCSDATIEAQDVQTDPYGLYIHGIVSFARAERLHASLNLPRDHVGRCVAATLHVVQEVAMDGHTAVSDYYVVEHASAHTGVSPRKMEQHLAEAIRRGLLVPYHDHVMTKALNDAEATIASKIKDLLVQNGTRSDTRDGGPDDAEPSRRNSDGRSGDG